MEYPIILAVLVFFGTWFAFLMIRLFANIILFGMVCGSAVLAYNIPEFYPDILVVMQELKFLHILNLSMSVQPTPESFFVIAILIMGTTMLISIPILPFTGLSRLTRSKFHRWAVEEIKLEDRRKDPIAYQEEQEREAALNREETLKKNLR